MRKDQDGKQSSANKVKEIKLRQSDEKYILNQWLITMNRLIVLQGEPTEYSEIDWEITVLFSNRIPVFPIDDIFSYSEKVYI